MRLLRYLLLISLAIKVQNGSAKSQTDYVVVCVSGVTCGGKTTLSNKLQETLRPVKVYHQDDYFYPDDSPRHVKCDAYDHINYEVLSSLNMTAMHGDIITNLNLELSKNINEASFDKDEVQLGTFDIIRYDHGVMNSIKIDSNAGGKFEIRGKKFIIVEGFTIMNYKPILELCNLRYYLVLSYEESFSRRIRRGYSKDVQGYFEKCVWPAHIKYKAEIINDHSIQILNGTQWNTLDIVLADLSFHYNDTST